MTADRVDLVKGVKGSNTEGEDFDMAILDVNLADKQSFAVADNLSERGIPFLFASGYGAAGLVDPYRNAPVLQKPFDTSLVAAASPPC